jgi:copper transport protein
MAAAGLVLAAVVLAGPPAGAHAQLVGTTPADGQTVAEAPSTVTLDFSERVSVNLGGVRVFDGRGNRVDRGNSRSGAVASKVVVGLDDGLDDGTYLVTWRAISADSHPVNGGFVFSVGSPSHVRKGLFDSLLDQEGDQSWQAVGAVLRGVGYVGLLLAAGGSTVLAWIGLEHDRRASRRLLTGAAVVGAVAVMAALGVGAITEPGVLHQVLGAGLGLSVLVAVVGAALLVLAAAVPVNPTTRVVTLLGGVLAAGSFAAAGHTRQTDPAWLATAADVAHAWAGAAWFGGLVVVALALRRRRADADPVDAASLVSRFSGIAGVALLVVAAAGGALAWGEVRALRALTSTTYGWLLVVKVGVVALVALAGAYNRFRLVPAVAAGSADGTGWHHLRRTVAVEAIGLVLVLGLTGVLVGVTPARSEAGIGSVRSVTTKLGTGTVNLTVDPDRAGPNTIHIYLLDELGRQVDSAEELHLQFSLPSRGLGPIARTPVKAGPGHWQLDGDVLSIPGRWRITVISRVSEFDEQQGVADLTVNP